MRVLVLYRPDSEHGRVTEEFIRNFQSRYSAQDIEVLNVDSREGGAIASLYDIITYPAVLVVQTDGNLQKSWEGNALPIVDEVVAYLRA